MIALNIRMGYVPGTLASFNAEVAVFRYLNGNPNPSFVQTLTIYSVTLGETLASTFWIPFFLP
jgi:hypothetical protein